ncbi:MAG: HXXEE domain-containing protein [Solirubrobacterales bacterium]
MALPDRHGHWPLVSAATAGPASALVLARRETFLADGAWVRWLPLPALLLHQTEEWVWPGGFLPWFNREVMGSGEDEYPITRRDGLIINVGMGWVVALAAGAGGESRPGIASAQLAMLLGNSGLHLAEVARTRTYNPGSLTAAALFLPLGIAGMRQLRRQERREGRGREVAVGAALGAASAAALMAVMRRRMRG